MILLHAVKLDHVDDAQDINESNLIKVEDVFWCMKMCYRVEGTSQKQTGIIFENKNDASRTRTHD